MTIRVMEHTPAHVRVDSQEIIVENVSIINTFHKCLYKNDTGLLLV